MNLSARQLTTSNLPVLVQGVLDGSGLTPAELCLEITESVLMDDASAVIDTLWELKAIGVTLAIDDFGTGYSSLSYLRRFPVDVLKVDQSFVAGLGPIPRTRPSWPPSSTWPTPWSSRPSPRASRPSTRSNGCGAWAATWPRASTSPSPTRPTA